MTNIRQKRWLFRNLLERHPDFFQFDSYSVWMRPVRHCISQIWIDGSSDPNLFSARLSIAPIYWSGGSPYAKIGRFSEDFYRTPRPEPFTREYVEKFKYSREPDHPQLAAWKGSVGFWEWTVPEIDGIFTRAVEEQVLPFLRPMAIDHREYLKFYRSFIVPQNNLLAGQRMAIALAEGALDEARECLGEIWKWYETDTFGDYEPSEGIAYPKRGQRTRAAMDAWDKASSCIAYRVKRRRILEVVEPLRVNGRAAIAAILHRWEAEAVRFHKVERWWQPTPFPIEEGLA